jgi:Carboxypeptidase regulatory-like domain
MRGKQRAMLQFFCATLLLASLAGQQSSPVAPVASRQSAATPTQSVGLRIAGVVVNASTGQPIAAASVAVAPVTRGAERDISSSVVTGADGRFTFGGLSRGKYSLMAQAHGFTLQAFERHDGYSSAIAVGPEQDSEHLVFRLQPDAAVEGVVTDDNNDAVQFAMVRLFAAKSAAGMRTGPLDQTQTDDQGHYHLGHLLPGAYYLTVSARPWYAQNTRIASPYQPGSQDANQQAPGQFDPTLDVTYPLTFYPDATDSADASLLQLAPGARETVNMVLHAVPSLHLRVRTGEGAAQRPVIGRMIFPRVYQRILNGYLDTVYNAPDSWVAPGVIEISGLAPGHYLVEIPPSTGAGDKGSSRGSYREIDLAGDTEINLAEGPGFVNVSGTVLFEGTGVPKRASIQLLNPETGESFHTEINRKGEFEFDSENVRPSRYLVALSGARGFYIKKVAATGAKIVGRALEMGAGGSVHLALIAAAGEAQVDGVALHEDAPFAGAMIVLVPQDAANNTPLFRRDQSDSDGSFTLADVVPGQYTVIAVASGWDLDWSNPSVLKPYLKRGETVQVPADGKLQVKLQVQ